MLKTLSSDLVRRPDALVKTLIAEITRLSEAPGIREKKIMGVSLGVPGLVDFEHGMVRQSPHFPLWKNLSLGAPLQEKFPFKILIENDANQAALGESYAGAGKEWEDFIMLTLGTGIGGGIIYQKKIFHGSHGFAGEVGHMVIDQNGLAGALGIRGTLETEASASGLRLQFRHFLEQTDPASRSEAFSRLDPDSADLPLKLAQLAEGGDKHAKALWEQFGRALACGIASLANAFGIFHFILGGGLLGAWKHFMPACQKELPQRIYAATASLIEIVPASLGERAGLVGAIPLLMGAH